VSVLRRSHKRRRREGGRLHPLLIALLVLLATVFVTFYAFNEGLPFVHRFTLYAVVDNSVNVRSGDPVRIAGIDVGAVQGTSPEGDATRISFSVSSNGQPVHKDATITIRDRLFLEGSYYLQLDPGSPSAPILSDGDTIPMQQTSSPVQFYQVLSTFDSAARSSLTSTFGNFAQGFGAQPGKPLSESGAGELKSAVPQLTPVLKDTAWITQALRGTQPNDVGNLLASASQVTGTLAASDGQLADLVTGLDRTASALVATDGALARSVSGLDQTLQVTPNALTVIDKALPPVVNLGHALNPSLKAAPPLLDTLTSTVQELATVLAPAERSELLTTLKATFEQFPSVLSELGSAFPIAKQVTDCLQTHIIPVFKAQVPDGSLSTGRPVWQDFAHFLPNVGGATGSFDANGPYTRTLAGAGSDTLTGGTLGTLPGVGQLEGTAPPGNDSLSGARPAWVGDLTASDFRPDESCATQKVPSLASPTLPPDLNPSK
jgi:phospholipid/cholesterol/gamma-HCH transport system substrate-binding protein